MFSLHVCFLSFLIFGFVSISSLGDRAFRGKRSRSGWDDSHTIFRAQSISGSLLGAGIVLPHAVGIEAVFITTGSERHTEPPDTVITFMHWRGVGVPVVEVAG